MPLLACWSSDFDCGYETNWWYCIKDNAFDISKLKSKHRSMINKGKKFFDVKKIIPADYAEELYKVQVAAFSAYPAKYRPKVVKSIFLKGISAPGKTGQVYGVFFRETGKLVGYSLIQNHLEYANLCVQKTNPNYEKYQINAALICGMMEDYSNKLGQNYYICDGSRNIAHETHFQDYLEKYFGFRKAYCRLHIHYRPIVKIVVKGLFPFRRYIKKMDDIGIFHKINAVLMMEQIVRSQDYKIES